VTRSQLWDRIEPLLSQVERPARYIDREYGAIHDESADYRAVLIYPDAYEIGQANQAVGILYARLNGVDGVSAERAYVPWVDMADLMRANGVPLFALESAAPVSEFDLIGITLPYELTYTNVLEALDLAGLPLRSADRDERHPLVIAGGPCAFNPEPVAPFFDAILIGEGEDAVVEIAEMHRTARKDTASRADVLRRLAAIPGVYVPSLYGEAGPGSAALVQPIQAEDGIRDHSR